MVIQVVSLPVNLIEVIHFRLHMHERLHQYFYIINIARHLKDKKVTLVYNPGSILVALIKCLPCILFVSSHTIVLMRLHFPFVESNY